MIFNTYHLSIAASLDLNSPPLNPVPYLLLYYLLNTSDIDPTTIIIIITIALEDDYSSSSSAALFPFACRSNVLVSRSRILCILSYSIVLFHFVERVQ